MKPEWNDKIDSMYTALRALNIILLETEGLEETAKDEAVTVKTFLDNGPINEAQLIDYLKQGAVDLLTHKRGW